MGSPQVCSGATLQCSFGAAPGTLMVLPINRVMVGGYHGFLIKNVFAEV